MRQRALQWVAVAISFLPAIWAGIQLHAWLINPIGLTRGNPKFIFLVALMLLPFGLMFHFKYIQGTYYNVKTDKLSPQEARARNQAARKAMQKAQAFERRRTRIYGRVRVEDDSDS